MKLIILGSGGYGKTVADVAEQLGYELTFLDDSIPDHHISTFSSYISFSTFFIPAFGNNAFRLECIEKIKVAGGQLATLIHPTAYISPKASISEACVVLPHAIINTDTTIERGCIINLGAIVDHGCVIEEGCHICLGAIVKGENRVERLTKIEAREVIEARRWPV
ncbi:hypothetical protein [Eubacterium sp.]|uniref:PglD-related sugar-binding protein n=1 Tax=Eubacterium sp. TaxID=142586 RepID=UPI0030DC9217